METPADTPRLFDLSARDRVLDGLRATLDGTPGIRWAYVFGSLARRESFREIKERGCQRISVTST